MRLLTLGEFLNLVPLKKSRVYYLTHTRQIPYVKVGRTLMFDEEEIVEWIRRQRVNGDGDGQGLPDKA
jgi:excisionase family DNA binding protein